MPRRAGLRTVSESRSIATSCVSSTAASRAAVPADKRSAIASSTMPPSDWASTPCWATGLPACKVAPRSSPPSKAVSLILRGIRRNGASGGKSSFSRLSHLSRSALGGERRAAPPRPAESTASNAATVAASAIIRHPSTQQLHDQPARWNLHRRADYGADGDAVQAQQPCVNVHRSLQNRLPMQPALGLRESM